VIALVIVYVALVLVLPIALSATVSYRSLPTGRRCVRCAAATLRLQSRGFVLLSRFVPSTLHRRWCLDCGWEGAVRVDGGPRRGSRRRDFESAAPDPGGSRTVDLRWLIVDGVAWRVRLEYWLQGGAYCGRLIFVAPSGRPWLDAQPLSAPTDRALVRHALAMSDRLLTSRLRELVSD